MKHKRGRRIFSLFQAVVCLATALGLALSLPRAVQAHASLLRSDPAAGTVLSQAPQTITLEFTEALDPDLSQARVVDSSLNPVADGPGRIDPNEPLILRLDLPPLPDGAYNIVWQVRSTVDGHITSGVVPFSVGQAASTVSLLSPEGASDPTTTPPQPIDTLLRWLIYLAAAVTVGSVLFGWLVWRPAYRLWDAAEPESDRLAAVQLRRLAWLGTAGLAVFSLGFVLFQAWEVTQGAFQISYSQALAGLLGLRSGWVFWLRLLLLALFALQVSRLAPPGAGPSAPWIRAALLALAVLLTFSLQSHAAALNNPLAVAADWLHLASMSAWIGGLLPFFLLLRRTGLPPPLLAPRFSRLALACVAGLALSGAGLALIQVRSLIALFTTLYGRVLAWKTILFAILIALGAVNLLVLTPRLRTTWEKAAHWLRNTAQTELAVGFLILGLAGVMTGVPPAFEALQTRARLGYVGAYQEQGVRLALWVAPGRAGDNEFAVDVSGLATMNQHEHLTGSEPSILLRFEPEDADLGEIQVEAVPGSASRYLARGSYLTIAGPWQVEVIVRQAGMKDIRHTFSVQVEPNDLGASLPNPVPVDKHSLAAGEGLYAEHCLACHGPQGKGDGPAGMALNPPPADLSIHTAPGIHPDSQLFDWITNGYPGSVMPAFEQHLTDVERWQLVNYIRTLAESSDTSQ